MRLYAQPGVSDACLRLQDEHGLDVNLVLFCIWSGLAGPGKITPDELSSAIARAGNWQKNVVEPIRNIRRTLKHDSLGASEELVQYFRPRTQALELDGEHVEQLILASLVPLERGRQGRDAAWHNLQNYLDHCAICEGSEALVLVDIVLSKAIGE